MNSNKWTNISFVNFWGDSCDHNDWDFVRICSRLKHQGLSREISLNCSLHSLGCWNLTLSLGCWHGFIAFQWCFGHWYGTYEVLGTDGGKHNEPGFITGLLPLKRSFNWKSLILSLIHVWKFASSKMLKFYNLRTSGGSSYCILLAPEVTLRLQPR